MNPPVETLRAKWLRNLVLAIAIVAGVRLASWNLDQPISGPPTCASMSPDEGAAMKLSAKFGHLRLSA